MKLYILGGTFSINYISVVVVILNYGKDRKLATKLNKRLHTIRDRNQGRNPKERKKDSDFF